MDYRGFKIEKVEGTNVGYAPDRHNKTTRTLTPRRRKVTVYYITGPDVSTNRDTLKEAKAYIDSYLDS